MSEKKPNTPAEFSVQTQDISDEELENVASGKNIPPEDILISPIVARTSF